MDRAEARNYVRAERAEFLSLLRTLTPDEWEAPSLCEGWRVRDVVAHMLVYDRFAPSLAWHFVRSGLSVDRVNLRTATAWRNKRPDALLARLEKDLVPGGVTRVFGWRVALQEVVVHQQDVRRPLRRPRTIPQEHVVGVLECLVDPPRITGVPNRSRGLRLEPTDVRWSSGDGLLVTGTAEAIVMALAGRQAVLEELTGPGVSLLRG